MSRLSISTAWDETKARLASDGRLLATVALALVALPSAISTLVNPNSGMAESSGSLGTGLVVLIMSLIAMVGQLALIRLAIGPSVSVGDAIRHAAKRALPYLGSVILIVIALLILAVPLIIALAAMGVSFEEGAGAPPAGAWIPILLFMAVLLYVGVRMLMSSSVASAESAGPIKILKRSWALTRGHSGKLIGFLLLFLVAVIVALGALGGMAGLLARALFGEVEPLSAAALLVGLVQGLATAAATTIFAVMLARMYVQLAGGGDAEVSVPPTSGT